MYLKYVCNVFLYQTNKTTKILVIDGAVLCRIEATQSRFKLIHRVDILEVPPLSETWRKTDAKNEEPSLRYLNLSSATFVESHSIKDAA